MKQNLIIRLCSLLFLLTGLSAALAQPTIVSTVPASGATGVSTNGPVVFTFSTGMDTDATTATFIDFTGGYAPAPVVLTWSAGNKVLTCTPVPAFANNHNIFWSVDGADTGGNDLTETSGFFTTGSVGGSGTNAATTFYLGRFWEYDQTNTVAPTLDPDAPYFFSAGVSLISNRTATAVSLTFPNSTLSNLTQIPFQPEEYILFQPDAYTNLTTFNAVFPAGNYIFKVSSNAVSQSVTLNLPINNQPPAPHVSNFTAAQTINPAQSFTLSWDAFIGGTSADYISVELDDQDGNTVFQSPDIGKASALKGTATFVAIPAGTLLASSNYDATIGFYRGTITTNVAGAYISEAFQGTITQFSVQTAGSAVVAPKITNATWSTGTFGFDILTSSGQMLTVVYNTNLTKAVAAWPILLTTNSPGSKVHITDPHSKTNKSLFYRVRNGS